MIETIIGVHFLLPDKLAKNITEITAKYQSHDIRPSEMPLHVTIAMAAIDHTHFDEIVRLFSSCRTSSSLSARFSDISSSLSSNQRHFYSQITLDKSAQLFDYHFKIISLLNQFRPNQEVRRKDFNNYQAGMMDEAKYQRCRQNGFADSGEFYRPHVSLGYYPYSPELFEDAANYYSRYLSSLKNYEFTLNTIEIISCTENLSTREFAVRRNLIK